MKIKNSCFNCPSSPSKTFKFVGKYQVEKCSGCGLIFLDSYPEDLFSFIDDIENESEEDLEFWSTPKLIEKYQDIFDHFMNEREFRLKSNDFTFSGKALDIGVGFGLWASRLESKGMKVKGIDVSSDTINYCSNKYSFEVEKKSFERFESSDKYDLISMFDVLEHFARPVEMLEKVKSLLNEDGLLYIQVPNVIGFKIPFNHGLGLPYHLWQFDRKSLFHLLNRCGFEILEDWTGVQGIIGAHERDEVNFLTKLKWNLANKFKIGNRIQVLVKVK